jgi:hypothetical protein
MRFVQGEGYIYIYIHRISLVKASDPPIIVDSTRNSFKI